MCKGEKRGGRKGERRRDEGKRLEKRCIQETREEGEKREERSDERKRLEKR
jgi:hypothetical protein